MNLTRINHTTRTFISLQDCEPKTQVIDFIQAHKPGFIADELQIENYLYTMNPAGRSMLTHFKPEITGVFYSNPPIIERFTELAQIINESLNIKDSDELYYTTYLIIKGLIDAKIAKRSKQK